jgi:hypothetical protein
MYHQSSIKRFCVLITLGHPPRHEALTTMAISSHKQSVLIALLSFLSLSFRQQNGFAHAFTSSPYVLRKKTPNPSLPQLRQSRFAPMLDSPSSLNMIWRKKDPKGMPVDFPGTKTRLVATIIATLATWHSIAINQMNPVLASSATTLAFSLWSPGLGQAAFCGSFAGMSSAGSFASTLTAGAITAGLFELAIHRGNKWLGLGGRLGFVAFLATNMAAYLFGAPHSMLDIPISLKEWISILKASPYLYSIACGALGSVATIVLREIAENATNEDNDMQDPIRAAAAIGVVSSLLVGVGGWLDNFGSLLVFGGAFTGMSLPSRLLKGVIPGRKKRNPPGAIAIVLWYAAAGALGGLIHALTIPLQWWSGGIWGGKAGSCAFGGVLIFRAFEKCVYWVRDRMEWTSEFEDYGELY